MKTDNANSRIEYLRKRDQEIRAQLNLELAKSRQRAERETARAAKVVGKTVIEMAAQNPTGFGLMLKQVLDTSVSDDKARELLRRKGLL
jgi:hypothetical protein